MEGVYLSCLVPLLAEKLKGLECVEVGRPVRQGLGLAFGTGTLTLCASPDSPGIIWGEAVPMSEPPGDAWGRHLVGAVIEEVVQQGFDRVLEFGFGTRLLYGASDTRLIFEATGRNANIILARRSDGRILACQRQVTHERNRYRTIVPGGTYRPPPPSGLPPGSWASSSELAGELEQSASPPVLYRLLEGVGPVTARAILSEAEERGVPAMQVVSRVEKELLDGRFSPWMGPDGPLPVELGPGHRIDDPLARQGPGAVRGIREEKLETWRSILRNRISLLRSRLERVQKALDELVPPEDYRIWGGLLLSRDDIRRKGLSELRMTDWEGREHTIPLRPSRSLKSNASRFYRKAANSIRERTSLERRARETREEMERLSCELESSEILELEELEERLREHRSSRTRDRDERSSPLLKELAGGWRCFIGRNAKQNEDVTFGIGRKGDIWFHARGIPGAHVVLKLDGKTENPPASVMREAALEAARGSGVVSGVVPVDYTRVQYVNRMKKGKTGQVTYSREKTLFVDLGGGK